MYSKTAIRELSARYRLILRKCFLLNLGLIFISTSALATSNNVQNGNVIIDSDTTMTQSTLDVDKLTITEGNSLDFTSDYKGVYYAINSTLHNIDQLEIEKNASASFKTTYVEFETLNLTDATSKENASQLSLKNSSFDGENVTIGQNNTLTLTDSELYGSKLTLKKGSTLKYTCLNCEDDEEDKENSVADFTIEFDNISANNATIVLGDTERATEQSLPDQASLEFKEQLNIQNNSSITLNENTQLFYSGFEGKGNISITDSSFTLNDNSLFLIGEEDDEASSEKPYYAPTSISNSSITLNNRSSIEVYDENEAPFTLSNSSLTLNDSASLSLTNLLLQGGSTLGLNTENTTAEIGTISLNDATINISGTLNVDTLNINSTKAKVDGEIKNVDIQINADTNFDKTFTLTESPYSDDYNFENNITVNKGKKLSILTPDSYKYENGYVKGEDDEDEFNRQIFMKDLTVNGGLEVSSTSLYADETTFGENASLTANMASIEAVSMTIATGSYNLKNDSSLDAVSTQTITGGTFTLDDSEMGGDEGVYISDGTFTLKNDSEIATNGFENAPDVNISGGKFTFNSAHILSRTEDERKGSITISGGNLTFNKGLIGAYNYSDNESETQEGGNIAISGGTITFNGGSSIHSEKFWDESKGILSNTILADNISLSGDAVMNISKGATLQTVSNLYMEDDYMDFEEAPSSLTISENATLNLEGNLRAQLNIQGGEVSVKKTSSIISGLSYVSMENIINLENNGVLTIDKGATLTLGHVEKNWGSSKNTIVNDTLNVNDGTLNLLGTLNADLTGSDITIAGTTGKINGSLKGFESLTLHNRGGKLSTVAKEFTDIDNITLSGELDSKGKATTTYTLDKSIFKKTENARYWIEWKYIDDDDDPYEEDYGFNNKLQDDEYDYDYREIISLTPYDNQVAGDLTIQTANFTSSKDLAVGNLIVQDNATATIKGRFVTGWANPLDDYNPTPGNISVLNNSNLTVASSPSNWEECLAIRNLTIDENSKFVANKVNEIGVSNLSLSNGSSLEVKNNTLMSTANLEAYDSSFSIDKAWFKGYESNINNSTLKATNKADVAFDILTATDSTLIVDKKATISSNDLTINDGDIIVETNSRLGALNKENIMIDEGYIFGYSLDEYFETPKSDINISNATITLNGTASLQNAISLTKITESGPDEIIGILDKKTFENPDLLIDKYIKQARKSGDFDYISEREYRETVRNLIQSQDLVKGNISLTNATIQMNGTSSIINSLFNEEDDSGYITFIGGDVIANGKNTISATEAVTFNGTNIEVLSGKTLSITSENNIGTTIDDIRLKLAGTLNAQLKGSVSTLVLGKKGKYTGKWGDLDFSGLTNFGISGITSLKDLGAVYDAYNRYSTGNLERFEITDKSKLTWDLSADRMLDFNSLAVNTGSTLDVKRNLIISGSLEMNNAKLNLAKDTYIQAEDLYLTNTNVNITGSTYYDRNGIYSTKLTSNNLVIDNEGTTSKTNLKNVTLLSSNGSIDYSAYITGSATLTNVSVKGDLWLDNEFTYDKKGNIVYKTPATLTNVTASAQSGEPTTQGKLHVRNQKVVLKSGNNFTDGINLYENAIVDVTDNTDTAGATNIASGTLNINARKTFETSALENNGLVNLKGILDTSSINGDGTLNIQNAKAKVYGDVLGNTLGFEKVKTNLSSIFYGDLENVGFDLTSSTLTIDKDVSLVDINMEKSTLNLTDDLTAGGDLDANASTLNLGTNKLTVDNVYLRGKSNINLSVEGKESYGQLIATDEMILGLGDKADKIALNVTIGKTVSKTELDGAQFNFLDYNDVYGNLSSVKINNNRYKFTETAIGQFEVEETTTGKGVIARYSGESKNAMAAATALVDNSDTFNIKKQQQLSENLNTLSQQIGGEQAYLDSLEATNPDTNGMVQSNESANINMGMDAAATRLSNGFDSSTIGRSAGDEASQQGSMWTKVLYNKSKMDSSNQYRGFKGYATGLAIGLDRYVAEDVKMGIAYAYTDADIKNSINKTTADSHFALLYGEYKPNNWFINSIASYGWSNYNQKATALIGATTADFDVHSTALKVTSGYDVLMNNTIITPALGILYTNIKREAYSDSDEKRISANSSDVITLSAMTKLKSEYKSDSNLSFIPEVRFGITYDVMNDGQSSIVNLSNGTSYTIEERALNRFGTEFGFGIRVKYDNRYEFSAGYELRAREDYRDQTALIEAKYHF